MIRVLQVVTDMQRGGLETFIMNHYRAIDRSRIQFDFLVHRLKQADYDEEIEALGGKIYRIGRLNPFSFSYHKQLQTFFDEHPEYRIIHVHQDCLSGIILREAERHGIPVRIAHSHNSNQTRDLKYPIKLIYRRTIPEYATHLAACSQAAGDWMFSGCQFTIIRNAIDSRSFVFSPSVRATARKELGITEKEVLVGHVGRFATQKNHSFLISAFYEIQRKTPSKLLLVGDGYLRNEIEQQIDRMGLTDRVILTGVKTDVSRYLQAMDVFVFPSIYEGLPVTLIEAQAAGLPCLISDYVPLECAVTNLVRQMKLDDGVVKWAEAAINTCRRTRTDTSSLISAAGYDIHENATWLMKYYERLSEESN